METMVDVCHMGNNDDCRSITVDVSNSTIFGVLFITELPMRNSLI